MTRALVLIGNACLVLGIAGLLLTALLFTTKGLPGWFFAIGEFFFYSWFLFLIAGYLCLRIRRYLEGRSHGAKS